MIKENVNKTFNRKKTEKLTNEEFNVRLKEFFPEYELIGEYINMRTRVILKCLRHGNVFEANPHSLLVERKTACPSCKFDNRKRHFFEVLEEKYPNIEVLGEYVNYRTKIKFRCKIHKDEIFFKKPSDIMKNTLKGNLCKVCRYLDDNRRKFNDWLSKFNRNFPNSDFDFSNSFWDMEEKFGSGNRVARIKNILCKKCGRYFSVNPFSFIKVGKCPECTTKSRGELLVENWLINNKIDFESQVYFSNSLIVGKKDNYGVIIDFIIKHNGINYVIECNGEFHYRFCPKLCSEGLVSFEEQLKRDKNVKEYFSGFKDYLFIEIPWKYYEIDKINSILSGILLYGKDPKDLIEIPEIRYNR